MTGILWNAKIGVKMRKSRMLMVLPFALLVACSTTKPIQKVSESKSEFDSAAYTGDTIILDTDNSGAEQYRVFSQGSTGFVPQSAVRANAETRANKFCLDKGMQLKILQERKSAFLQLLGNFPRSELIFVCVDQPNAKEIKAKDVTRGK